MDVDSFKVGRRTLFTEVWNDMKKKQFAPIYLVYGMEMFFMNETKEHLIRNAMNDEEVEMNVSTYDCSETPVEVAMEDAETLPFFGERKVVILNDPFFLTGEKGKGKVEHQLKPFETYIQQPAPYTILFIAAPYEKLDERKKLTKILKKHAVVLEAKKLNEQELKRWIRLRAEEHECTIEPEAIEQLLIYSGTNMLLLASEIDKMCLYVKGQHPITVEVVQRLASKSLEQNVFSLIDQVIKRQVDQALAVYYDLLKQNEDPLKILAILASQFRLIYQSKELARRGYSQQQIASHLKVHPFRVKLALGQAKGFSDEELMKYMNLLAEADFRIKSGYVAKELAIELFFFQLQNG
jgi:DNA polymerase III subunit delta